MYAGDSTLSASGKKIEEHEDKLNPYMETVDNQWIKQNGCKQSQHYSNAHSHFSERNKSHT